MLGGVTTRMQAMRALYEGSLADVGDVNPYAGGRLMLEKLWLRGYERMLRVRSEAGPEITRNWDARAAGEATDRDPETE